MLTECDVAKAVPPALCCVLCLKSFAGTTINVDRLESNNSENVEKKIHILNILHMIDTDYILSRITPGIT